VDLVRPSLKIDDAVVTPKEYPHVAAGWRRMDVTDLRELSRISARLYSASMTPNAAAGLSRAM
jgi:hypothetical protein